MINFQIKIISYINRKRQDNVYRKRRAQWYSDEKGKLRVMEKGVFWYVKLTTNQMSIKTNFQIVNQREPSV